MVVAQLHQLSIALMSNLNLKLIRRSKPELIGLNKLGSKNLNFQKLVFKITPDKKSKNSNSAKKNKNTKNTLKRNNKSNAYNSSDKKK